MSRTLQGYLADREARDPEFKVIREETRPALAIRLALVDARVRAGLTQEELAERLGTTQSAVARTEAGRFKPSFDLLQRYAVALNVGFEILPDEIRLVSVDRAA